METKLKHTLLAICSASLLLTACGGGGGGGVVRNDPPPPVVPPPPPNPQPASTGPCPAPITGDCTVEGQSSLTFDEYGMSGGRQSEHKLFVHGGNLGGGWVNLKQGEYRFAGGTEIAGTGLVVWDRLVSDVKILHDYTGLGFMGNSELWLLGTVHGNVINEERLNLRCWSGIHGCASIPQQRIDGNYTQLSPGLLETVLGRSLQVTGKATLDGKLLLVKGDAGYVLPTAPSNVLVLHADGGVSGTFASWSTDSLFLEGSLRYGSNDVWFDLTRISIAAAMAANATADPLTLASAANLDAALSRADGYALAPTASLDASQRRFLASAASVLHSRDVAHATRTLDSLAGHAHARAQDALHAQAATSAMQLDAHLLSLAYNPQASAWSRSLAGAAASTGQHAFAGHVSGVDQWLSPRFLIGASVAGGQSRMQFERMGGHGQGASPMSNAYAHYRNGDWHATGLVGAGRNVLQLERPIDLGAAGTHVAHSRRAVDQAFLHGELGRRIALGGGRLTPFVALDYSALDGDGFIEQGDTGFELVAPSARSTQWSAAAGARYAHDWRFAGNGRVQLAFDARYQQPLADDGDALRAAFIGAPDALFDLPAWSRPEHGAAMTLGLTGGMDDRWAWSLDYARRFGGNAGGGDWLVGLRRAF
jgi:uncharacterized protein with beta-barrel porin domain